MAKVNISFDTDDNKKINCTIDGTPVDNIIYLSLSQYDDKCDLRMEMKKETVNGLTVYTSVCASEKLPQNAEKVGVLGKNGEFAVAKENKSPYAKSVAVMFKRQ